jgi:molecular chaperone GrpE
MSGKKRGNATATNPEEEGKENSLQKATSGTEPSVAEPSDKPQAVESVKEEQPSGQEMSETIEVETAPAKKLSEEDQLKKQITELEDKFLRTAAEFDNYKKRMARQFEEIVRSANDRILFELLEVVDNFERALKHSNDNAENTDVVALRKGMELTFNQMTDLLSKYDVVPIDAVGQPFDPNLHEAVMQVESDVYPEGAVAIEMSKGYKQGDRVLRHSKVGVSKGKPKGD